VIAPVFFLLILGMIEVGRGVMVQQMLTNASREGARLAVLPGTTTNEVLTRVDDVLGASGITGATTAITDAEGNPLNPQDAGYGDVIKVTVSIPFADVSWIPPFKYLEGATLEAATVMRGERVQ